MNLILWSAIILTLLLLVWKTIASRRRRIRQHEFEKLMKRHFLKPMQELEFGREDPTQRILRHIRHESIQEKLRRNLSE